MCMADKVTLNLHSTDCARNYQLFHITVVFIQIRWWCEFIKAQVVLSGVESPVSDQRGSDKVLPFQKLIVWKIELPHPGSESLKQLMKSFSHPGESLYSIQSGLTIKHTYVELSQNFLNRQGIVGNTLFDITVKASSNCSVIDYKF